MSTIRALRGRVTLNLLIQPFGYRLAREYWEIGDPQVAFLVDALVGGKPGYRALIEEPVPDEPAQLPHWLARALLNPAHALFDETGYLLREDPRVQDMALYNTILQAIATGRRSPQAIGSTLGRPSSALTHALQVLTSAGFVRREEHVLLQRRPTYFIADPIVRFGQGRDPASDRCRRAPARPGDGCGRGRGRTLAGPGRRLGTYRGRTVRRPTELPPSAGAVR